MAQVSPNSQYAYGDSIINSIYGNNGQFLQVPQVPQMASPPTGSIPYKAVSEGPYYDVNLNQNVSFPSAKLFYYQENGYCPNEKLTECFLNIHQAAHALLKNMGETPKERKTTEKNHFFTTEGEHFESCFNVPNVIPIVTQPPIIILPTENVSHHPQRGGQTHFSTHVQNDNANAQESNKKNRALFAVAFAAILLVGSYLVGTEYEKYTEAKMGLKHVKTLKKEIDFGEFDAQSESMARTTIDKTAEKAEKVFNRVGSASQWGLARRVSLAAFAGIGFCGAWFWIGSAMTIGAFGVLGTVAWMVMAKANNSYQDERNIASLRELYRETNDYKDSKNWQEDVNYGKIVFQPPLSSTL